MALMQNAYMINNVPSFNIGFVSRGSKVII